MFTDIHSSEFKGLGFGYLSVNSIIILEAVRFHKILLVI